MSNSNDVLYVESIGGYRNTTSTFALEQLCHGSGWISSNYAYYDTGAKKETKNVAEPSTN